MRDARAASGVSAIVLAAGSSSRMGASKPLVSVVGKPMLEHVLSALRRSQVDEVIVVLGHDAATVQRNIAFEEAQVVINPEYLEGMASSLQTGLAHLQRGADAALVVLADQPFLQPQTVDLLIREYQNKRPEIVIPTHKGSRGNPVLLDRSIFPEIKLLKGDIGCRAIFGNHPDGIVMVAVEDSGILIDLDTSSDVEHFNGLRCF